MTTSKLLCLDGVTLVSLSVYLLTCPGVKLYDSVNQFMI